LLLTLVGLLDPDLLPALAIDFVSNQEQVFSGGLGTGPLSSIPVEIPFRVSYPLHRSIRLSEVLVTSYRFVALASCLIWFVSAALAQGVQPYPDAFTDRNVHPKTPMAPPSVNIVFQDPDFGAPMVRVTNDYTNPKQIHSYFRNPETETNAWSADESKFFAVGEPQTALAFGFDPSTMLISPLPGAGSGGGFAIPLYPGPTFSFTDPDLMYGVMPKAPLTIANFRFSANTITPLFRHHDMRNAASSGCW
jgi:hypothetical protein